MSSPSRLSLVHRDTLDTNAILEAMLSPGVSDLFFIADSKPRIKKDAVLAAPKALNHQTDDIERIVGFFNKKLSPSDTKRIASDLLGSNQNAQKQLHDMGACDFPYCLSGKARFRVNISTTQGKYVIVMRVVPYTIPEFKELNLPGRLLEEIMQLKSGLVLVTGQTGNGKSTTLASVIDQIIKTCPYYITTIEDPVEYAFSDDTGAVTQHELYTDTPSFSHALRAALRQSPNVIFLGEMRDREATEVALEAAETGHLVFSTLHTDDASKTVERIIGTFPPPEQQVARIRLASAFKLIIAQRLIPRKDTNGLIPMLEILKSSERTREYIVRGEQEDKDKTLLQAMRVDPDNLCFDDHLVHLAKKNTISPDTAMAYATDKTSMKLRFAGIDAPSEHTSNFLPGRPSDVAPGAEVCAK